MQPICRLQEIAAEAGVSRMTVSRALRRAPNVKIETMERVWEAAKRLGYRPDPLFAAFMRRMRYKKTGEDVTVLAYLTTYAPDSAMASYPYVRAFHKGAEEHAAELGYRLDEFNLPSLKASPRRLHDILRARGIRGIVIAPLANRGRLAMDLGPFACAAIGSTLFFPALHRAKADHSLNMQVALRELRKLGRRRIGLVMNANGLARTEYLAHAMLLEFQQKVPQSERIPLLTAPSIERGPFQRWLRRWRPQAIITVDYAMTNWLPSDRRDRPVIVNLNSVAEDGCDYGIEQSLDRIAAAAVDLVAEQLIANRYGVPRTPKAVSITGQWVKKTPLSGARPEPGR